MAPDAPRRLSPEAAARLDAVSARRRAIRARARALADPADLALVDGHAAALDARQPDRPAMRAYLDAHPELAAALERVEHLEIAAARALQAEEAGQP